jgi:hypothetical protein
MPFLSTNIVIGVLSSVLIVVIYLAIARRTQLWTKAIVFGALSAALIMLIYATPPYKDQHFGGANFGYNFSFFFPVVLSSFVFWLAAFGFYIAFLRNPAGKSLLKIVSSTVLLLPFALQAAWIIRILLLLREPV